MDTIVPYADAHVEGRVIAPRSIVVFEVYGLKRRIVRGEKCFFLAAARRKSGEQLFRLLPPPLRRQVSVLQRNRGTVGDVFRAMAADGVTVSFLPLIDGAALFVHGRRDDPRFANLRRFNRRPNRRASR